MLIVDSPIVSVNWLHEHLNASNLVVLNASINKPNESAMVSVSNLQIPKTRFFDIKNKFSDTNGEFPNTFPTKEQFEKEARELEINTNSCIIIYDDKGIYSSPRAWWLFKAFGHTNVAVLNGGLPEWKTYNFELKPETYNKKGKGDFVASFQKDKMQFFKNMSSIIIDINTCIIDARSQGRFKQIEAEPRKGLRSGQIPNSKNIPYSELLSNGKLKPKEELHQIFSTIVKNEKYLVFSCGSGITACILALAAEILELENLSVYDGSWAEYGSLILND